MDDYEQANAIMLMLIFWRAGSVILELNPTGLFILHVSRRGIAEIAKCVLYVYELDRLSETDHCCLYHGIFRLCVLNFVCESSLNIISLPQSKTDITSVSEK